MPFMGHILPPVTSTTASDDNQLTVQNPPSTPWAPPPAPLSRIASAIADIMREVGVVKKEGENTFYHYKYARMEDVLKRITPLLADKGIIILQTETERVLMAKDTVIAVKYAFTIVHASGEVWPQQLEHTGMSRCMDSKGNMDDKAINKCHTAARKYFLLALFQVPTGDQEEVDADRGDNEGVVPKRLRRNSGEATELYRRLKNEVDSMRWPADLDAWLSNNQERVMALPKGWQDGLIAGIEEKKLRLQPKTEGVERPQDALEEILNAEPPPSAWDALDAAKQAGILCADPLFWKFLNAGGVHHITDEANCAILVRAICGVSSRAELKVTESALQKWRDLVGEYRTWQRDPDEGDRIAWSTRLVTASMQGVEALKAEWKQCPKDIAAKLKHDLDTIHKPNAEKVQT